MVREFEKQRERLKITPRARRIAKAQGVNLEQLEGVIGTGFQGGICEKDLLAFLKSKKARASSLARAVAADSDIDLSRLSGSGAGGKVMRRDVDAALALRTDSDSSTPEADSAFAEPRNAATETGSPGRHSEDGKEILEEVPYNGVRKIIGDRLSQSKFTAPHLYFTQKVDMEELLQLRKKLNQAQVIKVSVTDYIGRAVVAALVKYPEMNASLRGDVIVKYKTVNLGIAVAAESGLIVPVVRNAEKMSLVEFAVESGRLIEKARSGRLAPDEYSGGTFTISNLGMYGIENFTAIINPPEMGILAISATKDEPWVVQKEDGTKEIAVRPVMNIQLSTDHRVIDGRLAAQFVTEIKRLLENPLVLLL